VASAISRGGNVVCPFVEISPKGISAALNACCLGADDCVYDVGCGKGNITSALLERYPCRAVGIEINPSLARCAKQNLAKYGDRARVLIGDVCNFDLSEATMVVAYFTSYALNQVSSRMASRLRPGCIWLNYNWPIPGWSTSRPASDGVYTYVIGSQLWDGFETLRTGHDTADDDADSNIAFMDVKCYPPCEETSVFVRQALQCSSTKQKRTSSCAEETSYSKDVRSREHTARGTEQEDSKSTEGLCSSVTDSCEIHQSR